MDARYKEVVVPCETCKGTGRVKRIAGSHIKSSHDGRRRPPCANCMGDGKIFTKVRADDGGPKDGR